MCRHVRHDYVFMCVAAHSKLHWEALGAKILQPTTVNDSKLIHTSAAVEAVNNDSVMMMLIELCFIKILVSMEAPLIPHTTNENHHDDICPLISIERESSVEIYPFLLEFITHDDEEMFEIRSV